MTINILIALCITSIILCSITAIFSILSFCKVVGLEKSTHQIQWMPIDSPTETSDNKPKQRPDDLSPIVKDFMKMYPDVESEQV